MQLRTLQKSSNCPQTTALLTACENFKLPAGSSKSDGEEAEDCGFEVCQGESVPKGFSNPESLVEQTPQDHCPLVAPAPRQLRARRTTASPGHRAADCCERVAQNAKGNSQKGGKRRRTDEEGSCSRCPLEKSPFNLPLTQAQGDFCLKHARQLMNRAAKGGWTIDLLLLLGHLPCAMATSCIGYNPSHADKASLRFPTSLAG